MMNLTIKSVVISIMILLLLVGCASQNNQAIEGGAHESNVELEEGEMLPLGSVVLLKGGTKKIMIVGRVQLKNDDNEKTIYDYSASYYPEGIIDPKELFLFNNENIDKVYFRGYEDEEELDFRELVQQTRKEMGN